MDLEGSGRLGRIGRPIVRYGCLAPLLIVWLLIQPGAFLILLGAPFLIYLLLRLLTIHRVQASMMREAGDLALASPFREDEPGDPPDRELRIQEFDETVDLPLAPIQAARLRQAVETGQETWRIFRRSVLVSLAVLFGLALGWTLLLLAGVPGKAWPIWASWGLLTFQIVLLYAVTRSMFLVLRRVPSGFSLGGYLFIAALSAGILFSLQDLDGAPFAYSLAIAAGIVILLRGYGKLNRRLRKAGDHPLLILRVFGADSNTVFLFGEILHRWCFLGSFATIVDPSYVRFRVSLASRENRRFLWIFGWSYLVWVVLVTLGIVLSAEFWGSVRVAATREALGWGGLSEMVSLATALILFPLAAAFVMMRVRLNFVRTLAKSKQASADPGRAVVRGGVFRGYALHCYDDIWKSAVSSLLRSTEVVLMDLRGFVPERRGCEFELGLLIDRFPLDRVVLLIDEGPQKALLFALLQDHWNRMSAGSPNRSLQNPVLKTYAPGVEDAHDITRILALLAGALPAAPGTALEPAGAGAMVIRGVRPSQARPPAWVGRLGNLDLAVSRPAVARVLIPLTLLAMGLLSYGHLQSMVETHQEFAAYTVKPMKTLAEAGPESEPLLPQAPLSVTAKAMAEPDYDLNRGSFGKSLKLRLILKGGLAARAFRAGPVKDLIVLGKDGRRLEVVGPLERNQTSDRDTLPPRGEQWVYTELLPASQVDRISEAAGRVSLEFAEPAQRVVVEDLNALLPDRGWIRLSHPRLDSLGEFDLARFSSDAGIQIRARGKLDDLQIYLFRQGAEIGSRAPSLEVKVRETGHTHRRRDVPLEELLDGTRMEIVLGTLRSEDVAFRVRDIPVVTAGIIRKPRLLVIEDEMAILSALQEGSGRGKKRGQGRRGKPALPEEGERQGQVAKASTSRTGAGTLPAGLK